MNVFRYGCMVCIVYIQYSIEVFTKYGLLGPVTTYSVIYKFKTDSIVIVWDFIEKYFIEKENRKKNMIDILLHYTVKLLSINHVIYDEYVYYQYIVQLDKRYSDHI